jgi:hypothetical protein
MLPHWVFFYPSQLAATHIKHPQAIETKDPGFGMGFVEYLFWPE